MKYKKYIFVLTLISVLSLFAYNFYIKRASNPKISTEFDLNELTIEALRSRRYEGGKITIEQDVSYDPAFKSVIISYPSDGFTVYALMNIPRSNKPKNGFPVIIINHGYVEPKKYSTVDAYKEFTDFYSRNGYVVIKPDFRGHGNSQGSLERFDLPFLYAYDVLNLIASLERQKDYIINLQKIGIWGHSVGGSTVLRVLVTAPEKIKAAVILAGGLGTPEDLYKWLKDKFKDRKPNWLEQTFLDTVNALGDPSKVENKILWEKYSPMYFLDSIKSPVQIHHGDKDDTAPLLFSDHFYEAMKKAIKEVDYHIYKEGDHRLSGPKNRELFFKRSLEFYDKYLKTN